MTPDRCVYCGHPISEHDMETGRCDHLPVQGFGSCPCGRDELWMAQRVRDLNEKERLDADPRDLTFNTAEEARDA